VAKGTARKAKGAGARASAKATQAIKATSGPSPNPKTNLILADIAMRGGGRLLRHAVERGLLGARYSPEKARNIIDGRSMTQTLVGTALARMATRSVPGALIVGGGLLAKTLFDRRKSKSVAKAKGEASIDEQAEQGSDKA